MTTLATLQTGNARFVWCVVIEGYDKLLTSHDDTSAVATAWAGTDWTSASDILPGLRVDAQFEQSIEPWRSNIDAGEISLFVMDYDGNDTFGIAVFGGGDGDELELLEDLEATGAGLDADGAFTVRGDISAWSSGDAYIGNECFAYTGTNTILGVDYLTGITRGKYHPFTTSGGSAHRFGRDHTLPSADIDVAIPLKIRSKRLPHMWHGCMVGVWAHEVTGTTVATKANAHLVFAGQLRDVQQTTGNEILIRAEDMRARAKRTLFYEQYRGTVAEGIYIQAGTSFFPREFISGTGLNDGATRLDVVPSGATPPYEVDAGTYDAYEIADFLNDWLVAEHAAGNLDAEWYCAFNDITGVWRFSIVAVIPSGSSFTGPWSVELGFPQGVAEDLGFRSSGNNMGVRIDGNQLYVTVRSPGTADTAQFDFDRATAVDPPVRMAAPAPGKRFTVDGTSGTFWDNTGFLPTQWDPYFAGSNNARGLFQIGGRVMVLAEETATDEYEVVRTYDLTELFGGSTTDVDSVSEEDEGEIEVKQVAVLHGSFQTVVASIFASTGSANYNATYDDLPADLGLGIPWEVLGDAFDDSLSALEAEGGSPVTFVIDKPVRFDKMLVPELQLRSSWLVWDSSNSEYTFAQFQNPVADIAVHTFDETTKASAEVGDMQRVAGVLTDKWLVNVVKISYNRSAFGSGDQFQNHDTIKYGASISDHGESSPFTIEARNSYSLVAGTGDAVKRAASHLIGKLLPAFGRPVLYLKGVPINPSLYEGVKPGDIGSISDDYIRDPSTGTKGLSGKPCLIIAHRYGWGGDGQDMFGEVDVIISDLDNVVTYSPTALVNTSGTFYEADTDIDGNSSSGVSRLKITAFEFSESGENNDVTDFDANDVVDIIEIDEAGASPQRWNGVTINATDSEGVPDIFFELDQNLTGFDTSGNTEYRIVSASYTEATASQKNHAYTADGADNLILDSRIAYEYGTHTPTVSWSNSSVDELPERFHTSVNVFGDGEPMATAYHRAPVRMCNNLIDVKLSVACPVILEGVSGAGSTSYQGLFFCPYWIAPGTGVGSTQREFEIALIAHLSGAGTGTVRVTLSFFPPRGNDGTYSFDPPYQQAEYSVTSTSSSTITAQEIYQVGHVRRGWGFLSVESKVASATYEVVIDAISEMSQEYRGQ